MEKGFSVPRGTGLQPTTQPDQPYDSRAAPESPDSSCHRLRTGGRRSGGLTQDLLSEEKAFTSSRFQYRVDSGVKPHKAGFGNPDVTVATLGAFEATNTGLFLASIQRAFPQRPVLVTTTHPDTFDFFQALEMGASDFLLPPLRRSELLPRLMRQAPSACRGDALSKA